MEMTVPLFTSTLRGILKQPTSRLHELKNLIMNNQLLLRSNARFIAGLLIARDIKYMTIFAIFCRKYCRANDSQAMKAMFWLYSLLVDFADSDEMTKQICQSELLKTMSDHLLVLQPMYRHDEVSLFTSHPI